MALSNWRVERYYIGPFTVWVFAALDMIYTWYESPCYNRLRHAAAQVDRREVYAVRLDFQCNGSRQSLCQIKRFFHYFMRKYMSSARALDSRYTYVCLTGVSLF